MKFILAHLNEIFIIGFSILFLFSFFASIVLYRSLRKLEDKTNHISNWIRNNRVKHKKCANCGRQFSLVSGEYQEICDKCYFRGLYGNTNISKVQEVSANSETTSQF